MIVYFDPEYLAREYRRHGGMRTFSIAGDKIQAIQMIVWSTEPPFARAFWQARIETLAIEQRDEVARNLAVIPLQPQ